MNITIIRHGQTDWNKKNLFQGKSNIPLNATGIKQAEELANNLKNEKIDIIFSSPLDRALHTAKIINKYHNAPIYTNNNITERCLGELEGKCASDYNLTDLWKQILNLSNKTTSVYGIEALQDLLVRCGNFLNMVISKYGNTTYNIYIVAHGSLNLALLLNLGMLDISKPLYEFTFENCCSLTVKNPKLQLHI